MDPGLLTVRWKKGQGLDSGIHGTGTRITLSSTRSSSSAQQVDDQPTNPTTRSKKLNLPTGRDDKSEHSVATGQTCTLVKII